MHAAAQLSKPRTHRRLARKSLGLSSNTFHPLNNCPSISLYPTVLKTRVQEDSYEVKESFTNCLPNERFELLLVNVGRYLATPATGTVGHITVYADSGTPKTVLSGDPAAKLTWIIYRRSITYGCSPGLTMPRRRASRSSAAGSRRRER